MHEPEKSDPVVVAAKLANNAEPSAAELVEPRTGTKRNADQQSTHRAQDRARVSQALERVRQAASAVRRQTLKVGAECPNWARSDLCGGRSAMTVPTANCPRTLIAAPHHVAVRIDPVQMHAFPHGLSREIVAKLTL